MMERRTFIGVLAEGLVAAPLCVRARAAGWVGAGYFLAPRRTGVGALGLLWLVFSCAGITLCTTKIARSG
jgi:hypothetical protein